MNQQKRIVPLEPVYMKDLKVDLKLYGIFQSESYYGGEGTPRYVPKNHPEHGRLTHQKILELYNKEGSAEIISLSTLKRKIKLFKDIGMIDDGECIDIHGNKIKAYILLEDFEMYQLITLETLKYLVLTSNSHIIKMYAYLLNKYLLIERKKSRGEDKDKYVFTLRELANAIGFKADSNNGATASVRAFLNVLVSVDLVNYKSFSELNAENKPVPKMRLTLVNQDYKKFVK